MTHDVPVHVHNPDPPANGPFSWTPERTRLLVKLRNEGKLSRAHMALEINKQTGSDFNKPAICGKLDRLFPAAKPRLTPEQREANRIAARDRWNEKKRLETRRKRIEAGLPVDGITKRLRIVAANGNSNQRHVYLVNEMQHQKLRCVEIEPRNLSLINLEAGDCRWPFGGDSADEPITFCGHPIHAGQYCRPHFELSRAPAPLPRRNAA